MTAKALCAAALLACGGHPGFPNAAPDAAPDAPPPTVDAGPNAVAITVTLRGAPAPGLLVYFQNADASLVVGATTDANGTASAVLSAGGYVTVVATDEPTGAPHLATFTATQPGDALHLDLSPPGPSDVITLDVTIPTVAGATSYQLYTSCGQLFVDATGTASGGLLGCAGAADILIVAFSGATPFSSLYAPGVAMTGQPVTLHGSYAALTPSSFTYAHVPPTTTTVGTIQRITTPRGLLFQSATSTPASNGQAASLLDMPTADGAIAVTLSEPLPEASDLGEQRVFTWGPANPLYTLDFATALLPPFAAAPIYDPATRQLSWLEGSASTRGNLLRARVHAFRDALPAGKAWTWDLVGPRGTQPNLIFPRLPADSFDFTPHTGDAITVTDLLVADVPLGYDSVRAHAFDDVQTFVTGPSGRLIVETLYAPPL